MKHKDHSHACECEHDHSPGQMSFATRWIISIVMVSSIWMFLQTFCLEQMLVRVTSYASYNAYGDVIRICKKIIFLDRDNITAWISLGYAHMDQKDTEAAMATFNQVLALNPQDKGAASFELGKAYFLKGNFPKAIHYFETVRNTGPRAAALLDADILKYRHGAASFRSLNSMQALLGMLKECYKKTGDQLKAREIQKELDLYTAKPKRRFF